ncbi:MAG: Flp pilus assembly complex ATPase component TadA, partial [Alphaproteobacteria bacterium]|nr:Flp pilus assembly complex ATPase component TadA [Alphaproteobacteria bacterium]
SLAEEIDKNHEADAKEDAEKQAAAANGTETSPANEKINYSSQNFLKELFSNGNECITAPGGSYSISDSTRSMLALFSNGRYFVAETHKYDGPPLLFVTDTKRRRLQIGQPEYVPLPVINSIYEYAAQSKSKNVTEVDTGNQEQARMQRDFVTIVSKAASLHVSDIHIIVADHTTVMFRINGLMQVELEYNKEWGESFVRAAFASADISDANYAQNEYQAAQKVGKTALRGSGGKLLLPRNVQGIRLQFNPIAFGTRYVVMRLLYDEENAESAGDLSVLGFEPQETEMFYRLRAVPTGIVIVAGPTGSGKSTTLQRNMISMLQERNYELNLITVEDPPEYPIPGARQMPVTNAATEDLKDREFTKALSASLRSDPDALMIGEIRTLSAADLAFRGALSGHNVWTTLHANSAPAILMRLKDMGVEDFKLQDPSIMKGLLSQRLFRKICPYCRVSAKDQRDNPVVQRLHQAFGDIGVELSYLRGPGCKHCEFRGVKGRTVVGEFILPDATFLDLMLRGESKKALDYWVTELNGRTLKEAAQSRMLKGIIDIEEVERWTGLFNDS